MVNRCKRVNLANIDAKTLNGYSDYWRGAKSLFGGFTNTKWYRVAEIRGYSTQYNSSFLVSISALTDNIADSSTYIISHAYSHATINKIGTGGFTSGGYCSIRIVRGSNSLIYLEVKPPVANTWFYIGLLELCANILLYSTPQEMSDTATGTVEASITGSATINVNNLKAIDYEVDINGGVEKISLYAYLQKAFSQCLTKSKQKGGLPYEVKMQEVHYPEPIRQQAMDGKCARYNDPRCLLPLSNGHRFTVRINFRRNLGLTFNSHASGRKYKTPNFDDCTNWQNFHAYQGSSFLVGLEAAHIKLANGKEVSA